MDALVQGFTINIAMLRPLPPNQMCTEQQSIFDSTAYKRFIYS